jgi:hypothetical protein
MKTTLQATLIAICALGMATAQAQTTVYSPTDIPGDYQSLGNTNNYHAVLDQLPQSEASKAVVYNGQVYLPKDDILGLGLSHPEAAGVAAGSAASAGAAAAGSTAVIIAVGVGLFAVIGAVVAGSASNGGNGTSTSTSTSTSTHH